MTAWKRTWMWSRTLADRAKKSTIYTRTGDEGMTSLFNGARKRKDDAVFEALGCLDDSNARIGLARELVEDTHVKERLGAIQHVLFDAGASVATPLDSSSASKVERVQFDAQAVLDLESWTDETDAALPPLRNFILPGGGVAAAHIHLARTAVRQAERRVFSLVHANQLDPGVATYLNRLSDYLFVAARFVSHQSAKPEVQYRKGSGHAR